MPGPFRVPSSATTERCGRPASRDGWCGGRDPGRQDTPICGSLQNRRRDADPSMRSGRWTDPTSSLTEAACRTAKRRVPRCAPPTPCHASAEGRHVNTTGARLAATAGDGATSIPDTAAAARHEASAVSTANTRWPAFAALAAIGRRMWPSPTKAMSARSAIGTGGARDRDRRPVRCRFPGEEERLQHLPAVLDELNRPEFSETSTPDLRMALLVRLRCHLLRI